MTLKSITKVYNSIEELKTLFESQSSEFLNIDEAAEYLKLKKSYIYNLVYKNLIPFYKPTGKKLLFNKAELIEWIKRSRIESIEEFEQKFETMLNFS